MPSNALFPRKRRYDTGKKRGAYNVKPVEKRGKQKKEHAVALNFWRTHHMDDIMIMNEEELSLVIDKFLDLYIEKKKAKNPYWHFDD